MTTSQQKLKQLHSSLHQLDAGRWRHYLRALADLHELSFHNVCLMVDHSGAGPATFLSPADESTAIGASLTHYYPNQRRADPMCALELYYRLRGVAAALELPIDSVHIPGGRLARNVLAGGAWRIQLSERLGQPEKTDALARQLALVALVVIPGEEERPEQRLEVDSVVFTVLAAAGLSPSTACLHGIEELDAHSALKLGERVRGATHEILSRMAPAWPSRSSRYPARLERRLETLAGQADGLRRLSRRLTRLSRRLHHTCPKLARMLRTASFAATSSHLAHAAHRRGEYALAEEHERCVQEALDELAAMAVRAH